ncbi:uncharacterized protein N7459_005188 [Penicillium hispanicum]|uniref:uncharacterized protein n=1 Tax=Penicillium hispanicum TaxID=1080232 RepID=UPI00253F957F|nr:uncharacterized protein N7459_005188 [Penicillium hispanicum]KAJ5585388.1 hypothetical protein N7459_005188 [Penicillium hispanicum]
MAAISAPKSTNSVPAVSPTTHEAFAAYSQDISRAIMTASHPKPAKLRANLDNMPPAPPPSPVAFAVDSNGKTSSMHREKIPNLNLE